MSFDILDILTIWPPFAGGPGDAALTLRQSVAAALAGSSDLTDVVGSRIYFGAVPQEVPRSSAACAYQVISLDRPTALDAPLVIQSARVQVSVRSTSALDVETACKAVRKLFHGFTGYLSSSLGVPVRECRIGDERDLPEAPGDGSDRWTYRTVLDVIIRFDEARP